MTGHRPHRSRHAARAVAVLVFAAVSLASAAPATAETKDRVGPRLSVFGGSFQTFPAGEPFHLVHGWALQGGRPHSALGKFGFSLTIDGVEVREDFVDKFHFEDPTFGTLQSRLSVFNFPDGLTGTHTFVARWFGPCEQLVLDGFHEPDCDKPNDVVTASFAPVTTTVEFVRTNLALGKRVTSSGEFPGNPASLAVDGNWFTYWSAGGFPPQWIEVDLGEPRDVAEITLGITQLPDSATVHRLYGRADEGAHDVLLQEFSGFTIDEQTLTYVAPAPQRLRYVRVETTASASWVGWREIAVYGP